MTAARHTLSPRGARRHDDSGQMALEFVGAFPYLVLGILILLQLAFTVTVVQSTSTAARAAARTVSQGDPGGAATAARNAVPSWMAGDLTVSVGADVSVSAPIPIMLPGIGGPTVTRRAWFEPEQGPSPWG